MKIKTILYISNQKDRVGSTGLLRISVDVKLVIFVILYEIYYRL